MFALSVYKEGKEVSFSTVGYCEKPRLKFEREGNTEYLKLEKASADSKGFCVYLNGEKHIPSNNIFDFDYVVSERKKIPTVASTISIEVMNTTMPPFVRFDSEKYLIFHNVSAKVFELYDNVTLELIKTIPCDFPSDEAIYSTTWTRYKDNNTLLFCGLKRSYKLNVISETIEYLPGLNLSSDIRLVYGKLLPDSKLMLVQGYTTATASMHHPSSPCILDIESFTLTPKLHINPTTNYPSGYTNKTGNNLCLSYDRIVYGFVPNSDESSATKHMVVYDLNTGINYESSEAYASQIGTMYTYFNGDIYCFPSKGSSTTNQPFYKKVGNTFESVANLAPPGSSTISNINMYTKLGKDGWFYTTTYASPYLTRVNPLTKEVQHFDMRAYGDPGGYGLRHLMMDGNQDLIYSMTGLPALKIKIGGAEKNDVITSPYFY